MISKNVWLNHFWSKKATKMDSLRFMGALIWAVPGLFTRHCFSTQSILIRLCLSLQMLSFFQNMFRKLPIWQSKSLLQYANILFSIDLCIDTAALFHHPFNFNNLVHTKGKSCAELLSLWLSPELAKFCEMLLLQQSLKKMVPHVQSGKIFIQETKWPELDSTCALSTILLEISSSICAIVASSLFSQFSNWTVDSLLTLIQSAKA